MRHIEIQATVRGRSAEETYRVLADFDRYAEHCEAVRDVTVQLAGAERAVSSWEVSFRSGILRWREEDHFDPGRLRITFRQLDGDIAVFAGSWQVHAVGEGSAVTFAARIDLGIPTLADVLEPIAVTALHDNITSILRGLFGAAVELPSAPAPALAGI